MIKKYMILLTAFVCMFAICPQIVPASETDDIILNNAAGIPDKSLYLQILSEMNKPENAAFTKQEAEKMTSLWISEGGVKDLTGIGYFLNLEELTISIGDDNWNLSENWFTSLKPLENLRNLKRLTIDNSKLTSLEGLEGLAKLESLDVRVSRLASLEGIGEGLRNLKHLEIRDGRLSSLKGIEGLGQLQSLIVTGNHLTSAKEVKNLRKLKTLDLSQNQLNTIKGIKNLTSLNILYLNDNQLTNISEVKNLKKLDSFSVCGNKLRKIPDLKNLRIKGLSAFLNFKNNYLTEKELKSKLKAHLKKKRFNPKWLQDQAAFQHNYKLKLTAPKSIQKITRNTAKISGTIQRTGSYKKEIFVAVEDLYTGRSNSNEYLTVDGNGRAVNPFGKKSPILTKVNENGTFVINKKQLKKQLKKKCTLYIDIYLYSEETKTLDIVERIPFEPKK